MKLGFLGPLEVRIDGRAPAALGGLRQRALLAVLGLRANEVVSTDRLVDELWGESPPATAVHTVQVFVSRLRGALAPAAGRLVTRPPGYVLELAAGELDATVCERLYESARSALSAGNPAHAAVRLHEAEELWRGPPLADFTYEPFAQATIARLEELRLSCREELIDAELALGRHAEVVSALEEMVRQQQFRERPRGQLMLALYRCGRQAEALDAFHDARRMLVQELAVEPSDALREMEQAILRQDPSLRAPAAQPVAPAPVPTAVRPTPAEELHLPPEEVTPAPTAAGQSGTKVRKTATVLVAKLAATGQADPEMAQRAVAAARRTAEAVVVRHGGVFVAGVAGELIWVFGVPLVQEDDALRAVRAAEELRANLAAATTAGSSGVTARLGVATGEVVAGGTGDLFGEPLTDGITLARAAQIGEVLLGNSTRRVISTSARVEAALDGSASRLLALVADAPARLGRTTPMIGRDRELGYAHQVFARAASAGETHLLTVIGDAGIGKSRFAQELGDRLAAEAMVLSGRCLSYGEGIAFWPLREALTQAAGSESRDAIRGLLDGAEDAELVADIIATTLRLAPADSVSEQVPWAFRRLLEVLAGQRPVILVLEDAHWAEPPLLELIDHFVDWLVAPVILLCLARPELLDVRPSWGGGHARVSSVVLSALGQVDALRLLEDQLGDQRLSPAHSAQILKTAEGNPLFVEQLLQASAEDPWWDRANQIPATIQSLLAARLDRLGPGERAVIERAAVIGREFWPDAVTEMLPAEARFSSGQHLSALVRRGLIQPDRSILAGEDQLRFHHILIRDVAYRSTAKTLRSELHERFADWLASHDDEYDEFVGYHLEQAFRYRQELDPLDAGARALAARAGVSLGAAGRRALSRGDVNPAVKLLRSAAELIQTSGGRRPDVLLDLGSAISETDDFPTAEPVLQAALEQARAMHADATGARALIELSYRRALVNTSFPVAEMLSVADEAVEVFTRVGDEGGIARAWHHVAMVHWIRSSCADMEQVLERALTHAERADDGRMQSRILGYLARATVTGPRPVDDGIRRCNAILDRWGDEIMLSAVTATMLAVLEAMQGQFDEARERWRQAERRLHDVGLGVNVAVLQMYSAFIELLAGTPENAEPGLAEACAVLERIGGRGHLNSAAALMARLLYPQGRYDECERYCRMSQATSSKEDVVSQVLWRGTDAKLLALAGEDGAAEEMVNSSVSLAQGTDFLMLQADALIDRAYVRTILGAADAAALDREAALLLYGRKGIRTAAQRPSA